MSRDNEKLTLYSAGFFVAVFGVALSAKPVYEFSAGISEAITLLSYAADQYVWDEIGILHIVMLTVPPTAILYYFITRPLYRSRTTYYTPFTRK